MRTWNLPKIPHGGWFPLVVAAVILVLMSTWRAGRSLLGRQLKGRSLPVDLFVHNMTEHPPQRVPGTAVYMHSGVRQTPPALLHNLKHNKVLHERVVLMSVEGEEIPTVAPEDRVEWSDLGQGFYQVIAHYGFMEMPSVPEIIVRTPRRLR